MTKVRAERAPWQALAVAAALLFGGWGADSAFAFPTDGVSAPNATNLGTVNFTLSLNPPGVQTNPAGGGPFLLTLNSANPSNPGGLGIPSSVMAWCIQTTETISVGGSQNATLYSHTPTALGGFVAEGLKYLNIVSGQIQFTAAGSGFIAAYNAAPLGPNDWSADEVAVAIQQGIWNYQLGTALPQTIGDQNAAQTLALLNDLISYASTYTAGYYRLKWEGQDQVFTVPVPGPIVGAGLPGLLLALGGFLAWRRKRNAVAA